MKKLLVSAAFALASVSAYATDFVINAGPLPVAPSHPWAVFLTHDVAGDFMDTINFSVLTSTLSSSANSINLSMGPLTVVGITDLHYAIWDSVHPGGTVFYGDFDGNNSTSIVNLGAIGNYHIDITGTATGTSGGLYSVALQTLPVPEPASYAMLLGGLALVGAIVRRRKDA